VVVVVVLGVLEEAALQAQLEHENSHVQKSTGRSPPLLSSPIFHLSLQQHTIRTPLYLLNAKQSKVANLMKWRSGYYGGGRNRCGLRDIVMYSLLLLVGGGNWVAADCPHISPPESPDPGAGPVVVYNRIPKCGSTTFLNLLRHHGKSGGKYYAYNDPNMFMDKPFAPDTAWTSGWDNLREKIQVAATGKHRPLLYINHIHWTNFSKAGLQRPATYIQLMREPVGRVVSAFYFLMLGPRSAGKMVKSQHHAMKLLELDHPPTINEYVDITANTLTDPVVCRPGTLQSTTKGNLMTRYFCGFNPVCANICSDEALEHAKQILISQYKWVGILEDLEASLQQLERIGPSWFNGLVNSYHKTRGDERKDRVTVASANSTYGTLKKEPPTERSIMLLQAWNSQDMKLYAFAKQHLKRQVDECVTFVPPMNVVPSGGES